MKKKAAFRREEKGAVLIITLLVTVALLILMMPFLSKVSGQYRSQDRSFKSYAALNLAEAGVEMAIWVLNDGNITEDVVVYISGPFHLQKGSKFLIEDGV